MSDGGSTKFVGVFTGHADGPFEIDSTHIERVEFVHPKEIETELRAGRRAFTPTFRHIFAAYARSAVPDDRVRLDQLIAEPGEISRAELLDLYKISIDEYRFQVTLNWQRTQYYFTVNTAVIAVAASILKLSGAEGWLPPLIVGALFALGVLTARLARRMIARGHTYYRRAVYKKTLIEHLLGRFQPVGDYGHAAANLAVATTENMIEAEAILKDPKRYSERRTTKGSVTHLLLTMMSIFMIVNAVAATLCFGVAGTHGWTSMQAYFSKSLPTIAAPKKIVPPAAKH